MKNKRQSAAGLRFSLSVLLLIAIAGVLFPVAHGARSAAATHNPRLIISEVYPNALSAGASVETNEWVEIQNLETHRVSLSGWMIEDAQAIAALPDVSLAPRAAVLIVGRAATMMVPASQMLIVLDSPAIGSGLRNSGDRVALVNPQGVRYDAVSWGDVRSPRFMQEPSPGESIVRDAHGQQRIAAAASPWIVADPLGAEPQRHEHPRPDTQMRIIAASFGGQEDLGESVTVRNVGDEPLRTVNWTLTVGGSLVRLRSLLLRPGDNHIIRPDTGRLGSGLRRAGGRLVLRDQDGNWLATASWGDDRTFHDQSVPEAGEDLRFNPLTRKHPRIPWYESSSSSGYYQVSSVQRGACRACHAEIAFQLEIERPNRASGDGVQQDEQALWISEVYPNAGQGRNDASYEWFELTSRSEAPIDLSGWTIQDNTSSDPLDGLVIPPRSSVVIGAGSESEQPVDLRIEDGRIGNGLANAGDRLQLVDPSGRVVNAISWGDDRTHSAIKAPDEHHSIHRMRHDAVPTVDLPTPGEVAIAGLDAEVEEDDDSMEATLAENQPEAADDAPDRKSSAQEQTSTAPPAVRITEILPAPLSGQPEWIELLNASDQPVDLSGWSVGDLGSRTDLSGILPAGDRMVIATLPLDSDGSTLVVDRIGNGLNNDADTIVVYDATGREVDRVAYGDNELPAPGSGLSVALDPARWVVTARPSPGTSDVVPLLDDAFRAAAIKEPVSDEGRLPVVQAPPEEGVNAWMIVSFALIGVILTLSLRRWQPSPEPPDDTAEPAVFAGPPESQEGDPERHADDETPPR